MARSLSDIEIQRALAELPGWTHRGTTITRSFEGADFPAAMAFVNRIAEVAERMNHHPDIDIRYTKVTCHLWTHTTGRVTRRDL